MKTIDLDKVAGRIRLAEDVKNLHGEVLLYKERILIDAERPGNEAEFDGGDSESAREICRELVQTRFLNPDADHMVHALFRSVLEHSVQRAFWEE